MTSWHDAPNRDRNEPIDVMVVLCSENYAAGALLAACEPAIVLQTFGGAPEPLDSSTRATFEYGIKLKRVRRVVVCGHLGCNAVALEGGGDARAHVVDQCRRLQQDAHIGALLRHHHATLHAILFDEREGRVYACDIESSTSTIMGDDDFRRLLGVESTEGP